MAADPAVEAARGYLLRVVGLRVDSPRTPAQLARLQKDLAAVIARKRREVTVANLQADEGAAHLHRLQTGAPIDPFEEEPGDADGR